MAAELNTKEIYKYQRRQPENSLLHRTIETYCYQCQYSRVVAFSCKRRGFCPSCSGRRMNDEADHIIRNVIPEVSTRQWVLSFPYKIRYILAHNQKLTNEF